MCPVCKQPLIAMELEGVEIDTCTSCGGTWLDAGELEQISELANVPAGPLHHALRHAGRGTQTGRRCPRCRAKLRAISVGEHPSVEIDRCPRGHGLWLDKGEMKTIVEEFAGDAARAVAEFFGNMFQHTLEHDPNEGGNP